MPQAAIEHEPPISITLKFPLRPLSFTKPATSDQAELGMYGKSSPAATVPK